MMLKRVAYIVVVGIVGLLMILWFGTAILRHDVQEGLLGMYGWMVRWQWFFLLCRYMCWAILILNWNRIGEYIGRHANWSDADKLAFQRYRWRALVFIAVLELILLRRPQLPIGTPVG